MNCDSVPSSRCKRNRTERHHGQRARQGIDGKRSHCVRAIIERIKTLVSRVDRQLFDRTTLIPFPPLPTGNPLSAVSAPVVSLTLKP